MTKSNMNLMIVLKTHNRSIIISLAVITAASSRKIKPHTGKQSRHKVISQVLDGAAQALLSATAGRATLTA
jgi:hypothetical protein